MKEKHKRRIFAGLAASAPLTYWLLTRRKMPKGRYLRKLYPSARKGVTVVVGEEAPPRLAKSKFLQWLYFGRGVKVVPEAQFRKAQTKGLLFDITGWRTAAKKPKVPTLTADLSETSFIRRGMKSYGVAPYAKAEKVVLKEAPELGVPLQTFLKQQFKKPPKDISAALRSLKEQYVLKELSSYQSKGKFYLVGKGKGPKKIGDLKKWIVQPFKPRVREYRVHLVGKDIVDVLPRVPHKTSPGIGEIKAVKRYVKELTKKMPESYFHLGKQPIITSFDIGYLGKGKFIPYEFQHGSGFLSPEKGRIPYFPARTVVHKIIGRRLAPMHAIPIASAQAGVGIYGLRREKK